MPTYRIGCRNLRELRRKARAASVLYDRPGDFVLTKVQGTLRAKDGDQVFATGPMVLLLLPSGPRVLCDGSWHEVVLAKSENVKLWIDVSIAEDQQLR